MITLRVREILQEKGKTAYWLAKEIGMSQNNMSKICNGETTNIRFDTIEKICATLECTPNDLIISTDPRLNHLLAYYNLLKTQNKIDAD